MTTIRMKNTRRFCEDGFALQRYYAGEKYKISDYAAYHLVKDGYAEVVKEK